jgi:hypothetical protein
VPIEDSCTAANAGLSTGTLSFSPAHGRQGWHSQYCAHFAVARSANAGVHPLTSRYSPASASSPKRFNLFGQRQPMEGYMMLIVSDETHDRTTADSVRPSSENRHTTARSDQMVARGVIGRVWARVMDIGYLSAIWRRCANAQSADTDGISIAIGKDECHVVELLRGKILSIPVHLGNIQAYT